MRALTIILLASASLLLAACASPAQLQPDFGDCYTAAFTAQADRAPGPAEHRTPASLMAEPAPTPPTAAGPRERRRAWRPGWPRRWR